MERLNKCLAHRATAEQDHFELFFQARSIFLQQAMQLYGYHRCKAEAIVAVQLIDHAAAWIDEVGIESQDEGACEHQLACDEVAWKTMQHAVTRAKTEGVACEFRAGDEILLRNEELLGRTGGAARERGDAIAFIS